MGNLRYIKVAEQIKVIVAELLERRIKDPRLGFVTITEVRVTGDLQHASVFYTVLGDEKERADTADALKAALARHHGVVAENAEVQLNDGAMLDNVLRQFHARHRGMRKAVISANGALTLQVVRALKRVGLIWGSDIGLLGFDELEWAELAGVGITTLKQPTWQIGYAAVEQVIRRIAGTNDPIRERVFSGELIVRGSTSR